MQTKLKIGQQIFFAILIAIIFDGLGINNEGDLEGKVDPNDSPLERMRKISFATREIFGAIFFASTNNFMGNMFNTLLVFQQERPVFLRE